MKILSGSGAEFRYLNFSDRMTASRKRIFVTRLIFIFKKAKKLERIKGDVTLTFFNI